MGTRKKVDTRKWQKEKEKVCKFVGYVLSRNLTSQALLSFFEGRAWQKGCPAGTVG